MSKTCIKCGQEQSVDEFQVRYDRQDRWDPSPPPLEGTCKKCAAEATRRRSNTPAGRISNRNRVRTAARLKAFLKVMRMDDFLDSVERAREVWVP